MPILIFSLKMINFILQVTNAAETRLAQYPSLALLGVAIVPSNFSATYCVYQTSYTTHVPTYLFSKYCLVLTCSSLSVSVVYQKVVANSHKLCCFKQVAECRCLYNHPFFVFTIKEVLKQLYFSDLLQFPFMCFMCVENT